MCIPWRIRPPGGSFLGFGAVFSGSNAYYPVVPSLFAVELDSPHTDLENTVDSNNKPPQGILRAPPALSEPLRRALTTALALAGGRYLLVDMGTPSASRMVILQGFFAKPEANLVALQLQNSIRAEMTTPN
jgi:hypothetical protein